MSIQIYRQRRVLHLAYLVIAMLILVAGYFTVKVAFSEPVPWLIWLALGQLLMILIWVVLHTFRIATQYTQSFYSLTPSEAWQFVKRSLIGVRSYPPLRPALRVQDGQADPDGPVILHEIGGPGYLSVGHNNVTVTQRLGRLRRIWGPEFGMLEPYERVWDVIDIRPQHRTLRVNFMTQGGIPAYCDAEMTFRVAGPFESDSEGRWVTADLRRRLSRPGSSPRWDARSTSEPEGDGRGDEQLMEIELKPRRSGESVSSGAEKDREFPYPYSEDAVLKLAANKSVTSSTDAQAISDWTVSITRGFLEGEIRDRLEQYSLEKFLDPIAALKQGTDQRSDQDANESAGQDGNQKAVSQGNQNAEDANAQEDKKEEKAGQEFLEEIESDIMESLRKTGRERGIRIMRIELTELKPDDSAISKQWLETWQAQAQVDLDRYQINNRMERIEETERARINARKRFIESVLERLKSSSSSKPLSELSARLIVSEFLAVLESMSGQDPEMQELAFQQSENLIQAVNAIQQGDSPSGLPELRSPPTADDEEEDVT